jgi:predicted RNA binding protein YcfA (HicA-like mRNA interferase family)
VKYSELIRVLHRNGWIKIRQTGSHMIMIHPGQPDNPIVVPNHGNKEIGIGLQIKILKQAGIKK